MKIGFIGTGLMGFPMVKNLLNQKLNISVFTRTLKKAEPLKEFGANISKSLAEARSIQMCGYHFIRIKLLQQCSTKQRKNLLRVQTTQ